MDTGRDTLEAAASELAEAADLRTDVAIAKRAARSVNGADGACFVLSDGSDCHYIDEDAIGPLWKGQRFPRHTCISGWTMDHGEPAVIPDVYLDLRIPLEAYRQTFVRSLIAVPFGDGKPLGALTNYWASGHLPTDEEARRLASLAGHVAQAWKRISAQGMPGVVV